MTETRRHILTTFFGAAVVLPVKPLLGWLQDNGRIIKPHPYPDGRDPSAPAVLDSPSPINPKAIEMQNQKELKELRANVLKLYDMVLELKEQVEKTNANSALSLSVMKKAQQIEKLAKQIKNLTRG